MTDRRLELKVLFSAVDKFVRPVKNITAAASEASKALKATRDRIKDLDSSVAKIDAFKKVQADAAITANVFENNRRKIDELKAAMASAGVPTRDMAKEMERLTRRSDELKEKHQSLVTTEQQLFEKLKAAGVDTNKLADERRRLASASAEAVNASRNFSAALDAESQKMKRINAARTELAKTQQAADKWAGRGAKIMAAGAAVNAVGAIPVMAYAKAEDSATQLRVAMMQAGGKVSEQFKEINDLAEKLGNRLPGTTSDYQDMMTMLIRQGMPAKNILGGLGEATAYLAVQLKMMPTAAAEFASELQDATRTADKDMMVLMDTIQKAFYLGVNQNNMLQGFAKLSPALSILRKEGAAAAKELAPLLVMTNQSGMAGEAAGNAFRKIFQMSMDAKHVAKGNAELAGTGVKLDFTDGKGEFGGLEKMYQQLDKLKNVNTQQRLAALKKIFGDDAETLQALTIMIEKGSDGYKDVQAKMAAQASLQERVNAQLQTLKNLWDAATGTFTNALVAFGESIAPELHATAEWLGKLAEKTQAWAKENPAFAAAIMTTVKWLGLALVAVGGVVTGLAALAGPVAMAKFAFTTLGISGFSAASLLARSFNLMMSGIGLVGRALLLNPIGLTITAIAGAAFLIYKYWDPIKAFFSGLWDQVKQAFSGGIGGVAQLILNWSPLGLFYQAFAGVMSWFGVDMPAKFTDFGRAIIEGMANGLLSNIALVRDAITNIGESAIGWMKEKLGIHSPSRVFAELGGFTMQGFEQGLQGGEDGPLSAVSSLAKKLAGVGAGVVIGGAAMAADIPLDTRTRIAPGQGNASGGMSSGNTFIFNVYASPGMNENDLAKAVRREFEKIQQAQAAQARSRLRDSE